MLLVQFVHLQDAGLNPLTFDNTKCLHYHNVRHKQWTALPGSLVYVLHLERVCSVMKNLKYPMFNIQKIKTDAKRLYKDKIKYGEAFFVDPALLWPIAKTQIEDGVHVKLPMNEDEIEAQVTRKTKAMIVPQKIIDDLRAAQSAEPELCDWQSIPLPGASVPFWDEVTTFAWSGFEGIPRPMLDIVAELECVGDGTEECKQDLLNDELRAAYMPEALLKHFTYGFCTGADLQYPYDANPFTCLLYTSPSPRDRG